MMKVSGAPARTAARSASDVFRMSMPTSSQAAASSSVAGQVWQSWAVALERDQVGHGEVAPGRLAAVGVDALSRHCIVAFAIFE